MVRIKNREFLLGALAFLLIFAAGCNRQQSGNARTDSQVAGDIQNKINSDANLPNKQIAVGSSNGVVTLSGTVGSESERLAAGNDASQVEGVKTVVNNLVVSSANGIADNMPADNTRAPGRAAATRAAGNKVHTAPLHDSSSETASNSSGSRGSTTAQSPNVAPAPSVIQDVTIPPGTILSVRTIDPIDTARAQIGDTFNATLDNPVEVDGKVVIPEHADVQGRVSELKSAGKFEGASLLALQVTKISFGGKSYRVITDQWSKTGASRGKNTAEKVGAGAGLGAIIGAIAGGGKGAAIGAGVGAGVGGGAQAVTHGQQIVLQPETVLQFTLRSPVTVTPSASYRNPNRTRISDNNNP